MPKTLDIEVNGLIKEVERVTGYDVLVDSVNDLSTYSDMKTATPGFPRHLIRINQELSKQANYLIALQCAMILARWTESGAGPQFGIREEKLRYFAGKVRKDSKLKSLPDATVAPFAAHLAQGLIRQLCSLPAEMVAGELCWARCPGLREQQIEIIHRNLRDMGAALEGNIRNRVPSFVFEKNAAMNAAFALWWSAASGEEACVIPFESLGFKKAGHKLYEAYTEIEPNVPSRVAEITDAWAGVLEMRTLYEWIPTEDQE